MKVLVTGATGLVGKYTVNYLLNLGYEVSVAIKSSSIVELPRNVDVIRLDLPDPHIGMHNVGNIDAIIHLAAYIPDNDSYQTAECSIMVNGFGTKNLLDLAVRSGVKTFIYASSISAYGEIDAYPLSERHKVCPDGIYSLSKRLGELFCDDYQRNFGIRCVIMRLSSVFGISYRRETLLPKFIKLAKEGLDLTIYGSGLREQDFVYAADVAQAIENAIRKSSISGYFNIGSGVGTTTVELANAVRNVFNRNAKVVFLDVENDDSKICLDISKAKRELDYEVKFSLEDGLKHMRELFDKGGLAI